MHMLRPRTNFLVVSQQYRKFSDASTLQQVQEKKQHSVEELYSRMGVDMVFDSAKHAHVLTFPWNFPEVVEPFEAKYRPITGFWAKFVDNSNSEFDFNCLYREFHQSCALMDNEGIEKICEPRLAEAVNAAVQRIHFHGLDIEMANLTVHQPSIKVLKCEITHGLSVDRNANGSESDWTKTESSLMGAPCHYYAPKNDTRSFFDNFEEGRKPYCVAVTALIESPMKLFVQNQNYSKILFGSDDQEHAKNVVRFEANVSWSDLIQILPINNKPSLKWRITDFNNLVNENPFWQSQ